PVEAAEYLSYIKASSSRMTELITGLMDYSRVGKNRKFICTSINELIGEVLDDMKSRIDQYDAQINIQSELPRLAVSRVEFKMLFQNLLSNAIKFHKAGVPPIINISAKKENEIWHFIVEDNGIG